MYIFMYGSILQAGSALPSRGGPVGYGIHFSGTDHVREGSAWPRFRRWWTGVERIGKRSGCGGAQRNFDLQKTVGADDVLPAKLAAAPDVDGTTDGLRGERALSAVSEVYRSSSRAGEMEVLPRVSGRLERLYFIPGKRFEIGVERRGSLPRSGRSSAVSSDLDNIIGTRCRRRLRASIWQSIFSHDMRRYRRVLYRRWVSFRR